MAQYNPYDVEEQVDPSQRFRRWRWTLFNWTSEDVRRLNDLLEKETLVRYVCWAEEDCPSTGRPHLQGYTELTKSRSKHPFIKMMGLGNLAVYRCTASSDANINYCKGLCQKKGFVLNATFSEHGACGKTKQGKRTDLDRAQEALDAGASMRDMAQDHFSTWIKYERQFKRYQSMFRPPKVPEYDMRTFPDQWQALEFDWSKTQVIFGETNIGKTSFACALMGPGFLFVSHIDDLLQFDPESHTGIIFDDIDIYHIPRTSQIHLVDQDQDRSIHCRYNTATIPAHTKKIFSTNNSDGNIFNKPDEPFPIIDPAIMRRIQITELKKADFQ